VDWTPAEDGRITDAIYEEYGLQAIRIPGAMPVSEAAERDLCPPIDVDRHRSNLFLFSAG
tara:strand:+ start:35625 stop:35804 length:180 start_codon:yes stop_codon:yes gene_type:complete